MHSFPTMLHNIIGESLGKSNTGRLEPIPIEVRNDRSGIGREDALQKVIETKYKIRQKHREDQMKRKELNDQNFAEEFRYINNFLFVTLRGV